MFGRIMRRRAAPTPLKTLQECRDEAAMNLGYAILGALDDPTVSPVQTATRAMIEALIIPYLTRDDFLSVARYASSEFTMRDLPWVPKTYRPTYDDDAPDNNAGSP